MTEDELTYRFTVLPSYYPEVTMPKQKGMNKYQKAAFRPGEHRTRRHEIEELLELAQSADPAERAVAAQNLCPCHVRRRLDEVWQALYRESP